MTRALGFLLAVLLTSACAPPSADTNGSRPSGKRDKGTATDDDELADDGPAPTTTPPVTKPPVVNAPVDAGTSAGATTYVGTLDATPTVRFGGKGTTGNYCNYDITLKTVTIEISALPSGEIIAGSVKHTAVEASVPPCTFSPAPPSVNDYAFASADGAKLTFKGAASNSPATSLVVDLVKKGASYEAAAVWHRTDQGDPLDWTVRTAITLGPR